MTMTTRMRSSSAQRMYAVACGLGLVLAARGPARAQLPSPIVAPAPPPGVVAPAAARTAARTGAIEPPAPAAPAAEEGPVEAETEAAAESSDAPPQPPALVVTGYVDVGFAKAQGNGTSFLPGDTRLPADYGVDTFAPAVNSRGEVASTDSGGRSVNGFLPRSVGIGGTPSFLINTANVDFRYTAPDAPVLVFTRLQVLPRFTPTGEVSRLLVEQAFGRITPLPNAELAIHIGKFDSVVGIEYLDNQANLRVGVTPSLLARYTTGQSIGIKAFYRYQIIPLGAAVSANASATNSGTFVEALQGPDRSLTGVPVLAGRLGIEVNKERWSLKIGGSALHGPRNDQFDREVSQRIFAVDLRFYYRGVSLSGEFVSVRETEGGGDGKLTGAGPFPFATGFDARGGWGQLAYELPLSLGTLHVTPYVRYEQRHAQFAGFIPLTVDRITGGLNLKLYETVQVKGEILVNRELAGAPTVANNVYTSSVVWSW